MGTISGFLFGQAPNAIDNATASQAANDLKYQQAGQKALSPFEALGNAGVAQGLQSDFLAGLKGINASQYNVNAPTLNTSGALGDVSSFLDPSMEYQMEQATKQVQSSNAGKGGLFSGAAGQDISNATQKIAEQGWGTAYDRALAEKNRQNEITQQDFGNKIQAGQTNVANALTDVNAKGTAYQTVLSPLEQLMQGQLDLAGTQYNANTGLTQQKLGAQAADTGYFGTLLGAGTKLASQAINAKPASQAIAG